MPGQAHSLYRPPAAVSRRQGGQVSSPLPGIGVTFLPQRRHRRFRTRRSSVSKNRPRLVPAISPPHAPDCRAKARPARARRPPIGIAVRRHSWDTGTASRACCAAPHGVSGYGVGAPCGWLAPRRPDRGRCWSPDGRIDGGDEFGMAGVSNSGVVANGLAVRGVSWYVPRPSRQVDMEVVNRRRPLQAKIELSGREGDEEQSLTLPQGATLSPESWLSPVRHGRGVH